MLALLVDAVLAHAQAPSTPYLRWKYFYDQRAYPFTTIPPGAMQSAREDYRTQWPPPREAHGSAAKRGLASRLSSRNRKGADDNIP